jgi:AbrB family looped-hinge helix DNA binding protein
MSQSTISTKYQVVIPLDIRRSLGLKPGQKVKFSVGKDKKVEIDTRSPVSMLAGKYTGYWGDKPEEYVRKIRDEWDR